MIRAYYQHLFCLFYRLTYVYLHLHLVTVWGSQKLTQHYVGYLGTNTMIYDL